jgi:hypothetical protein
MAKPSFKRNAPTRTVGKKILIACEGKQTEPKYFNAIRQDLRLTTGLMIKIPLGQSLMVMNISQIIAPTGVKPFKLLKVKKLILRLPIPVLSFGFLSTFKITQLLLRETKQRNA